LTRPELSNHMRLRPLSSPHIILSPITLAGQLQSTTAKPRLLKDVKHKIGKLQWNAKPLRNCESLVHVRVYDQPTGHFQPRQTKGRIPDVL
jgi:hypothetical protein